MKKLTCLAWVTLFSAATAALFLLAIASAQAGSFSASTNAPTVLGYDIANLVTSTGSDKWYNDGKSTTATAAKGQTFTTPNAPVLFKAITYKCDGAAMKAAATSTPTIYTVRLGTVSGTTFTQIASETVSQTFTNAPGSYMTWTLDTPVLLAANTTYAVDVAMTTAGVAWNYGIPYLSISGNVYAAGQLYNSGVNGVGANTLTYTSGNDRIFHIDLDLPYNPNLEFLGGDPPNGATHLMINTGLVAVATFSQNLTLGSGNITLRNLTDATAANLPVADPRITLSANLMKIAMTGLVNWNKRYAVQIDPGAVKSDGGVSFAGITNNTTWTFTTALGDPLVLALGALKDHINGVTNLTAAQIAAQSDTIDANATRFAESSNTLSAVFDLVRTYDRVKGPLWIATGSLTRSTATNDLTWTVYRTMQNTMDRIYNTKTVTNYEVLLNGFKFNSSSNFPGAVAAPPTNQSYTVSINGSFPHSFGRSTQGWDSPARKPTGAYLAPGTIATVTVPASLVGKGFQVRVGAHSWDFSNKPTVARLDRSSLLYDIISTTTKVASPLGGGIYIEVPQLANAGIVSVTITGAARAPFFSATSFHQTTLNEWISKERTNAGPWADFQSDKFMMQVPRSWIYNFSNPLTLITNWDLAMDACNDLMGFPHDRGKETMYYQVDLLLRASVYAPGYPTVNVSYNPKTSYGGNYNHYLITGPQYAAQYVFHEQGHSYFFPKFPGETESAVNLLHVPVWNRKFGYSLDDAFRASVDYGNFNHVTTAPLENSAVLWMTSFDFSPRQVAMADWEKAYQPQGHAKFVDIARLYGWDGLGAFWYYYNSNAEYSVSVPTDSDSMLVQLCKSVGKDVRPLLHFWGILPINPTSVATQVAGLGLTPPAEIYDRLLQYKALLPTNNASYQAWCLMWYGQQPSINGYGVEREHARQWSTTLLNGTDTQQRYPTEIYDEAAYAQVAARAQGIINLYYPNGRPVVTRPVVLAYGPRSRTSFPLTFSGPSGQSYHVLCSTNAAAPLLSWTVLSYGVFGASPETYTDLGATNRQQFYRIQSP